MLEWVWFAGTGRLKHLALMRASVASKRYAWLNVIILTAALGLLQGLTVGWRQTTATPALEPTGAIEPAGEGWFHVAGMSSALRPDAPAFAYVDMWWNPVQSVVAMLIGWLAAIVMVWLALVLVRLGVTMAHGKAYRSEQRMTAAIHYSVGWGLVVVLGALIACLRPLSYIGEIVVWSSYPRRESFDLAAGVVAGFGVIMWWFWLVRLGAAARAPMRGRVVSFFVVGVAAVVAATGAGWWWGVPAACDAVFQGMNLQF